MPPQQKSKGKKGKKAPKSPPPPARATTASSSNITTTERKNFNPKAFQFVPGSASHGPPWSDPSCLPANMVMSGSMPSGPLSTEWSGPMWPCGGSKAGEFVDSCGPPWGMGMLPAHTVMSGGMPAGPSSSGWYGPMGPCGGGWPTPKASTEGMGEDENPKPAPKGVAAMWNLDHSYTEESLRVDLLKVDFEPEQITSYGANKGALRACARKDIRGKSVGHSIGSHRP